MDKLSLMQSFVEVASQSGFTAAAEQLGVSRAHVSKSVMQLEQHLGTRLFNRTTRQVSLTETGRLYFERCQQVLEDINEIEQIAQEQSQQPRGLLRIAAPTSFGVRHLNPLISKYLRQYPDMAIDLSLSDRLIDVVAEGYDVAIRIAQLSDSSLVARRLAPCRRVLVASSDYLQQFGTPQTFQDLTQHNCLIYNNDLHSGNWVFSGGEKVRVKGSLHCDNGDVLKQATLEGLGVAMLPTFIVGSALQKGHLIEILPDHPLESLAIYAVYPSRRYLARKVRTFLDFLGTQLGEQPSWDEY